MTEIEKLTLIKDNTKLVYSIANKVIRYTSYCDMEDLFQVGIIALMKAYQNFDKEKSVKFSTYAFTYILGEMKKYIRENTSLKAPRDFVYLKSKVERAIPLLEQKYKRKPTIEEISNYFELDKFKIIEILQYNSNVQSMDETLCNNSCDNKTNLYDVVPDKHEDIDYKLDFQDAMDKRLSTDEQFLLKMRYYEDRSQKETAELMGISQAQVSRYEKKILKTLNEELSYSYIA